MNNSLRVFYVRTVETCVATEDDVLMASGPGGKHMALYEVCNILVLFHHYGRPQYIMCQNPGLLKRHNFVNFGSRKVLKTQQGNNLF